MYFKIQWGLYWLLFALFCYICKKLSDYFLIKLHILVGTIGYNRVQYDQYLVCLAELRALRDMYYVAVTINVNSQTIIL